MALSKEKLTWALIGWAVGSFFGVQHILGLFSGATSKGGQ